MGEDKIAQQHEIQRVDSIESYDSYMYTSFFGHACCAALLSMNWLYIDLVFMTQLFIILFMNDIKHFKQNGVKGFFKLVESLRKLFFKADQ